MKTASTYIALAAAAFRNKDFDSAGSLFAQAAMANDMHEFLIEISDNNEDLIAVASVLADLPKESDFDHKLASSVSAISLSMKSTFNSALKARLFDDVEDELLADIEDDSYEDEDFYDDN